MAKWKIESANVASKELEHLLNTSWEPFAISNQGVRVWLRKEIISRRGRPKSGDKEIST